jgi:hypothetical protein
MIRAALFSDSYLTAARFIYMVRCFSQFRSSSQLLYPLLLFLSFSNCAGPEIQRPLIDLDTADSCQTPSGFYSNHGKSLTNGERSPTLASLLWEGDLPAFGVDKIHLDTQSNGNLLVTAWVAEGRVNERLELDPQNRD